MVVKSSIYSGFFPLPASPHPLGNIRQTRTILEKNMSGKTTGDALYVFLILPVDFDRFENGRKKEENSVLTILGELSGQTPGRIMVQFLPKNQFLECWDLTFYIVITIVIVTVLKRFFVFSV